MLYMGSVNRLIFWMLIPLLLISYLAFRVVEWRMLDDGRRSLIAEHHAVNLSDRNDINCLILGGSNAVFSLSAEQMSTESGLKCYNLSLLNEGFSDKAYFDFINSMPIDRMRITSVFYSSVYPLTRKYFAERMQNNESKMGISGKQDFQLLGRSLASYLKNMLQGKPFQHHYPSPTSSGDFNFDLYDRCDSESINDDWTLVSVDDAFRNWFGGNLLTVRSQFQNAQIYFVLPSTLRSNVSDEELTTFSNLLQIEVTKQSVTYIEQSPFQSRDVLCDSTHHANSHGRRIRTSELLTLLHAQND
ncbi:MAG: hypothetical protein ACI8PW_001545 [Methylophilaceae bacterium]|jgi:hypothetical protein